MYQPKFTIDGVENESEETVIIHNENVSDDLPKQVSNSYFFTSVFKHPYEDGRKALVILFLMNLFNYCDRYAPSGIKEFIKEDLQLTDAETGLPVTAFLISYILTAPVFAHLMDNGYDPRKLIFIGVFIFSISTICASFVNTFEAFLITRCLVGIGEAAYATIGPVLLTTYYPMEFHSRVLSLFYLATPMGAALGYEVGGWIALKYGWRNVFIVIGIPSLLCCLFVFKLKWNDQIRDNKTETPTSHSHTWKETLKYLFTHPGFILSQLGCTSTEFATGALGDWCVSFLYRYYHYSRSQITEIIGPLAFAGGVIGTLGGSWVSEHLQPYVTNKYFTVCTISNLFSALFMTIVLYVNLSLEALVIVFFSLQVSMWLYVGPSNCIVGQLPMTMRSRAFSISILLTHLCGDAFSPFLVGFVSDEYELKTAMSLIVVGFLASALFYSIPTFKPSIYTESKCELQSIDYPTMELSRPETDDKLEEFDSEIPHLQTDTETDEPEKNLL